MHLQQQTPRLRPKAEAAKIHGNSFFNQNAVKIILKWTNVKESFYSNKKKSMSCTISGCNRNKRLPIPVFLNGTII